MGGLLSLPWSPFSDALASASPGQKVDPFSGSPRQLSSTPSPVLLSANLRKILGPNPHLSDNKLLRSWEYAIWMMSYCVACTLFGVLAVTLLPDPKTLELIRGGGEEDDGQMMEAVQNMMMGGVQNMMMGDVQNMMMEAQNKVDSAGYNKGYGAMEAADNVVGSFVAMDDTDGDKHSYGAMEAAQNIAGSYGVMEEADEYHQGFGEQNNTGGEDASAYGTQDSMSNTAQDTEGYVRYRKQNKGVVASDGYGKKKPHKRHYRYKDTTGEPPKNYHANWAQFNNKRKTHIKSSPKRQSPKNIPPSSLYQMIHGHGGSFEGPRQPLVSAESSYTSYSSQPS